MCSLIAGISIVLLVGFVGLLGFLSWEDRRDPYKISAWGERS